MGSGRFFGELLRDALDEMSGTVVFAPGEIEADVAELHRRLAQARRELDEEDAAAAKEEISADDLHAFVRGEAALTHAQQRRLFVEPALRAQLRALLREHAVELPAPPGQATSAQGAAPAAPRLAEMPARIAAADEPQATFSRDFAGGTLRIAPVGIDRQVYVVIRFDDPATAARALEIERPRDQRIVRLDLPPADEGEIVLIKDLAVAEEAELVELLRDLSASGVFLRR